MTDRASESHTSQNHAVLSAEERESLYLEAKARIFACTPDDSCESPKASSSKAEYRDGTSLNDPE